MRKLSVIPAMLAGFCAFLPLYAPQPILPMLAGIFHASQVMVSLIITACTAGVALAAPITGSIADRAGRKRIIVFSTVALGIATLLTATSTTLFMLIFWRFVQGLLIPGVFSVTTAYVHDEWPAHRAASAIAAYVSGTVMGGFSGRIVAGFAAERWGWRFTFVVLACAVFAIAAFLALRMSPGSKFSHPSPRGNVFAAVIGHLRNPRLTAAYGIGSCVLFTQVAMFTYVTFHLAEPPYLLGPGVLGTIYFVYLAGAVATPIAGRFTGRDSHPSMLRIAAALAGAGALIALLPSLWTVLAGLALCCSGVFIAQSTATSFVGLAAGQNRALALGLYVTFYYAGGSLGGLAPGWLWSRYNWAGCIALVLAVQLAIAALARKLRAE